MPYLEKNKINTKSLITPKKFFNLVKSNFARPIMTKNLSPAEFESIQEEFMSSADCNLILYSFINKHVDDIIVVSEETPSNNDRKSFKKIPELCKCAGINILTLPQLLEKYKTELIIKYTKIP